jgi:hypothetical protein
MSVGRSGSTGDRCRLRPAATGHPRTAQRQRLDDPQRDDRSCPRRPRTSQACKTLAHELAHVDLGHGTATCTDSRSQAEVEAESVAYIVASTAGLDTSAYSFPYIGYWAPTGNEADVIADTAERVITTARRIITGQDALDGPLDTFAITQNQEWSVIEPSQIPRPEADQSRSSSVYDNPGRASP